VLMLYIRFIFRFFFPPPAPPLPPAQVTTLVSCFSSPALVTIIHSCHVFNIIHSCHISIFFFPPPAPPLPPAQVTYSYHVSLLPRWSLLYIHVIFRHIDNYTRLTSPTLDNEHTTKSHDISSSGVSIGLGTKHRPFNHHRPMDSPCGFLLPPPASNRQLYSTSPSSGRGSSL
jgi:hypothetical protein